ncbi:nitrogenase cofactor biosynthesis protein NifB [Shewanella avicenniae]|uniref:FeMo cofactor biosynthesis protein NifB n=1 Tax=Shewanella avicenniae TaxID=2814294 RepID=A0ABX7QS15_9GAMM|nr:nitrogenase cofactor biosynthesis protein NifB [Shewanella avicenniae]QSX34194.1 nitrogenase cofactor biosynthesis protein NifB [Shewanella avicenniae]
MELHTDERLSATTSSCPSSQTDGASVSHLLPKDVQQQIARHPCYSKQAHQYARMHLPVAPACNIQCNYCNRKYDCSNESRPGVVSHLVDPHGALKQFRAIKKRAPNLTVVGIAGPGDALANPKATFSALKLIRDEDPSAQLCISTNGLMLADYADALAAHGVNHLTITINTIRPEIAAQIYPWIYYDHQRLRGLEAAERLIRNQLAGLEAAAKLGMLVKVNTVLIPGINDADIAELSAAVKARGALLHNIMPLISAAEHGTYFGVTGQRGPTEAELASAREASGQFMPQMTHCQQCRADAVGTLGGGCGTEADNASKADNSFKVAVATNGEPLIKTHFGHAQQFEIYRLDPQAGEFQFLERRQVAQYCNGESACPDEEADKQAMFKAIEDCRMVLCSRIGIAPWRTLEQMGITPNVDHAFAPIDVALAAIANSQLAATTHSQKESSDEVCHY